MVVVAIIAIIAAMLLPALKQARQQALGASCANWQNQQMLAYLSYAMDCNEVVAYSRPMLVYCGYLPMARGVSISSSDPINGGTGEYGRCPAYPTLPTSWTENITIGTNWFTAYGTSAGGTGQNNYVRMSKVKTPSMSVFVGDTLGVSGWAAQGSLFFRNPVDMGRRHGNGANAGFVDGHVGRVNPAELDVAFYVDFRK